MIKVKYIAVTPFFKCLLFEKIKGNVYSFWDVTLKHILFVLWLTFTWLFLWSLIVSVVTGLFLWRWLQNA